MKIPTPNVELRLSGWPAVIAMAVLSADAFSTVAWAVMLAAGWR